MMDDGLLCTKNSTIYSTIKSKSHSSTIQTSISILNGAPFRAPSASAWHSDRMAHIRFAYLLWWLFIVANVIVI